MKLAPIVLFVYNRPDHTAKTLQALRSNLLSKDSTLYIFADGAKSSATEQELYDIKQTKEVIRKEKWCKEVIIKESLKNKGLANSVINGVSEVLSKHSSIIVLEDDIVVTSGFLKFMNTALNLYDKEEKVFGISGYTFESNDLIQDKTYFLPVMSSWGYATWRDRWQQINFDSKSLNQQVFDKDLKDKMSFGKINFYDMLQQQVNGVIDSWAVRFYTSMLLQNGVFLYPKKSLLTNIGLDGSGVHCNKSDSVIFETINEIELNKIDVKVDLKIMKKFKFSKPKDSHTLKNFIKKNKGKIAPELLQFIRRKRGKTKMSADLFDDLRKTPRFVETKMMLHGFELLIPDAASFLFMYDEIFDKCIYNFKTKNERPYIIDGGANIGLSTIYFKHIYPNAQVIAFEPDPYIFNILQNNISNRDLKGVQTVNQGLWNEETNLTFLSEGADAGTMHLSDEDESVNKIKVKVTSLIPYLNKKVDFLKLDIEGAEFTVLKDIEDKLDVIENIFVEYHSFIGEEQCLSDILEILKKAGFRIYTSNPGNVSKSSPLMGYGNYNNMDFQLNIFGVRIKEES